MNLTAPKPSGISPARLARMNPKLSTFKTDVIDSSETAYYLRERLGPLRAWSDFLTDVRRGKTQLAGHELVPCCRIRGRGWVPAYSVEDVEEFIAGVLNDMPEAGPKHLTRISVTVAPAAHWRSPTNSYNKDGTRYIAPASP